MKIKRMIVHEEETNCYILHEQGHAIIIDPGDDGKRIKHFLKKSELCLDKILLTHGHCDHTGAVDYLVEQYHCEVYIDPKDRIYYEKNQVEGSLWIRSAVLPYPTEMTWLDHKITIDPLPGHSEGSVLIQVDELYFSGDVLFKDGIGRYDLVGCDRDALKESIEYLLQFSDTTVLYPGHEEAFTIADVKENNTDIHRI
ncbi:MAG: MBL fold metallo-hydrolase [Erysipelotrichaceae bacterium]|nr:MBL fold metallo-hydrolase [Erysipelotrichaceae bacterium]